MFNNYIIKAWRQVAWFNDFESLIVQTTGKTLTTGVSFHRYNRFWYFIVYVNNLIFLYSRDVTPEITSYSLTEVYVVNMAFDASSVDWSLLSRLLLWSSIPLSDSASVNSVLSVLFIDIVKGGIYSRGMT